MATLGEISKISGITPELIDFKQTDPINNKGLYQLDNTSYFLLLPNYLNQDEKTQINALSFDLDFQTLSNRTVHYTGPQYEYKNTIHKTNDVWNSSLLKLKAKLELTFLQPINSVLVNRYNKNDSLPFHQDNEKCLGNQPIIYSLSSGEQTQMIVKHTTDKTKVCQIKLIPGSLLIMGGDFNYNYYHSIPKHPSKKERLNLTFRYIHKIQPSPSTQSETKPNEFEQRILNELKELKDTINELKIQIKQKDEHIDQLKSKLDFQKQQDIKNDIVILKSDLPNNSDITPQICTNLLNKLIENGPKILPNDIEIKDFRNRKGPLVLKLKDIKTKLKILHIKSEKFVAKNRLTRESIILRKKAMELKKKGVIRKIWEYKGNIFFTTDQEEKEQASTEKLNLLTEAYVHSLG